MERRELTFRVFVSSTFSDLVAERNALQEHVFPLLSEHCQKRGCRFQAIDLRWGVSEEAALDQQTMNICLDELQRCQRVTPRPNFIVLLGQRYGWCPLPSQITATEFEAIRDQISDATDRALLRQWYWRDDNAVPPEYCLQPRQVNVGEKQPEPEKEAARDTEAREWRKTEHRLRGILLYGVSRLAWPEADERRLKYEASATYQEVLHGALQVKDPIDHVFGFFRIIEGLPQDGGARDYLDLDLHDRTDLEALGRLERLQADIRTQLPNKILTYSASWARTGPSTDHLRRLRADVYDQLRKVIDEELQRRDHSDPVDQEAIAHRTFGEERARVFIGRQDLLRRIQQYLNGQDRHPLVVYGVPGSGKSALMAKSAEQQSATTGQRSELVVRYIGTTPLSSDIRSLLEGLCKEITLRYGGDVSTVPTEYNKLVVDLPNRLALAKMDKPLVIFLDALDQLSDADQGRNQAWLPAELPGHVRLVVSTLPGECLTALEQKFVPKSCLLPSSLTTAIRMGALSFLEVTPMDAREGEEMLAVWLRGAHRTLQPYQRDEVLTKFRGCPYPLYLKLAFEEARRWKSISPLVKASPPGTLSLDVPGVLKDMFARLEAERNHGRLLVSRTLGYLAASRFGLTEDELLDLLSADKEVMADFRKRSPNSPMQDRLPVVVWARLFADLESYLTQRQADGTTVLTFYHRQVAESAVASYLTPVERANQFHLRLAQYFSSAPALFDRKRDELPWHQAQASDWDGLLATLLDRRLAAAIINKDLWEAVRYWKMLSMLSSPEKAYQRVWSLWPQQTQDAEDLAGSHSALSRLLSAMGYAQDAQSHLNASLLYRHRSTRSRQADKPDSSLLAIMDNYLALGVEQYSHGKVTEAEINFENALAICRELYEKSQTDEIAASALASCHHHLCSVCLTYGATDEALQHACSALAVAEDVHGRLRGETVLLREVARSNRYVAEVRLQRQEFQSALATANTALRDLEQVSEWTTGLRWVYEAAVLHGQVAQAYLHLAKQARSLSHCLKAIELACLLSEREANNNEWQRLLCDLEAFHGELLFESGTLDQACQAVDHARRLADNLLLIDPGNELWKASRAACSKGLAGRKQLRLCGGRLDGIFRSARGMTPPDRPLRILWQRSRVVADQPEQFVKLVTAIATNEKWSRWKRDDAIQTITRRRYYSLPNADHGGVDVVLFPGLAELPNGRSCPNCGFDYSRVDGSTSNSTVSCLMCGADLTRRRFFADLRGADTKALEIVTQKVLEDPKEEAFAHELVMLQQRSQSAERQDKNEAARLESLIRSIGLTLGEVGNDSRMERVAMRVRALGGSSRLLEFSWAGICGWSP